MKQTILSKASQVAILLVCIIASVTLSSCEHALNSCEQAVKGGAWGTLHGLVGQDDDYPIVVNDEKFPTFHYSISGVVIDSAKNEFRYVLRTDDFASADFKNIGTVTGCLDELTGGYCHFTEGTVKKIDDFFDAVSGNFFKKLKSNEIYKNCFLVTGCNVLLEWRTRDGATLIKRWVTADYFC